jgi:hypothetical protein
LRGCCKTPDSKRRLDHEAARIDCRSTRRNGQRRSPFPEQAGLKFDVWVETQGGVGIAFHMQTKKGHISSRCWDIVMAQGHSLVDQ